MICNALHGCGHFPPKGRISMKKSIFVAAIIAAACSGVALAGDAKQIQKTTQVPTIKATRMSDAEMDKVAASPSIFNATHACSHAGASHYILLLT